MSELTTNSTRKEADVLRVEHLYYILQRDWKDGLTRWFEMTELGNENINKLLPGEIKKYIVYYDQVTQVRIHSKLAAMEFNAGHHNQALGHWDEVRKLGETAKRADWIASALIGQGYCEKNLTQALERFQKARQFCEDEARKYLPATYNLIGFTYRRMQNINDAINWYQKARDAFQENPWDNALGARIANDLGYAYSLIGNWAECRESVKEGQELRQIVLLQLEQEAMRLEKELTSEVDKKVIKELQDRLASQTVEISKARLELGLSHNTLGEIYRYDNDLDASLRNYGQALELFEKVHNQTWQAKALFSRAETYRRIARVRYWENDDAKYHENMRQAQEDVEKSLYLCERYQVKEERDTANRRMGRVLHDLALHELERNTKSNVRDYVTDYLEKARSYFEAGLKYAQENNDVLEELSNQAELAFIVDDFMNILDFNEVPKEYQDYLNKFKVVLDNHREDRFRIHQFSVFENLYKLERAATDYQSGDYENALKGYLEAYVGLASDPGYGRTRFKQHFPHLTDQIEKLPAEVAQMWCREFVKAWEENWVQGKHERTLAQEIHRPDLVVWCRQKLSQMELHKG